MALMGHDTMESCTHTFQLIRLLWEKFIDWIYKIYNVLCMDWHLHPFVAKYFNTEQLGDEDAMVGKQRLVNLSFFSLLLAVYQENWEKKQVNPWKSSVSSFLVYFMSMSLNWSPSLNQVADHKHCALKASMVFPSLT